MKKSNENKSAKELVLQYYPRYWPTSYLINLVEGGKLTPDEYTEITGHTYPGTK